MDREERSDKSGSSSDEVSASEESLDIDWSPIEQFIQSNQTSTSTKLFSFLALLNAYVPESYLVMSECQQVLGPPEPIHGGPPFEGRMKPFRTLIKRCGRDGDKVCLVNNDVAKEAVARFSLFETACGFFQSLCRSEVQPHLYQFIKDLLTKRKNLVDGRKKFSRLIEELKTEHFCNAVKILEMASDQFRNKAIFPQTLSRLYYIDNYRRYDINRRYEYAITYAEEAIRRAPDRSYIADTLGQIYKNWLSRAPEVRKAKKALEAFKDVENKAEREGRPETADSEGPGNFSNTFNNRGLFGFMQVTKIISEKLPDLKTQISVQEIQEKFDFFEWYLTYSRGNKSTYEPPYFWLDIVQCYEFYTVNRASESTTFPGLLECLNHELFQSRGQHAQLKQTVPDLEDVQPVLRLNFEGQTNDIKAAERYILSNILLCNQKPDSPLLAPLEELCTITATFMRRTTEAPSPEFYLLVLLLFWPKNQSHSDLEEDNSENEVSSQASGLQSCDELQSNDENGTDGESEEGCLNVTDLKQQVANIEEAFERVKYAKYLRGRYLLPLFFLGKGVGLRRWIHKSKLDAIVENKVNTEMPNVGTRSQRDVFKQKMERISKIWSTGEVWHIPEIQNILDPVNVEEQDGLVWVRAGRERVKVRTEEQPDASDQSPVCYYLGFNIRGPVVVKVGPPKSENRKVGGSIPALPAVHTVVVSLGKALNPPCQQWCSICNTYW